MSSTLLVGPADRATVFLMFGSGVIRAPPQLSKTDTLIQELIKAHPPTVDLNSVAKNLLGAILPLNNQALVPISNEITELLSSQINLTVVDLTTYDINVKLFHEILVQLHQNIQKKLTVDEYWPLRDLLNNHVKYIQPLNDEMIADWKKTPVGDKKNRIYEDLFAAASHRFTDVQIVDMLAYFTIEVFKSDFWSITEDRLFKILKAYRNKLIDIVESMNDCVYSFLKLNLLSNEALADPCLKFHPNIHQALCDRMKSKSDFESRPRYISEGLGKDFLIVHGNNEATITFNGKKYSRISNLYTEQQCIELIYRYISTYSSFSGASYVPGRYIGVGAYDRLEHYGKDSFIDSNGKMSINLKGFLTSKIIEEDNKINYCIYAQHRN